MAPATNLLFLVLPLDISNIPGLGIIKSNRFLLKFGCDALSDVVEDGAIILSGVPCKISLLEWARRDLNP